MIRLSIAAMLLAGELDAAILAQPPKDEPIRTLIPDLAAAAEAWKKRTGAGLQINHMVVVKDSVSRRKSDELYALLAESRKAAGNPPMNPFGIEENRRNLEAAIDCIHRQGMIPRRYTVEELFE